jgi:hypothetical protein
VFVAPESQIVLLSGDGGRLRNWGGNELDVIEFMPMFQSPNASGRSRQGEPVRTIDSTPSTNIWLSRPVEPNIFRYESKASLID